VVDRCGGAIRQLDHQRRRERRNRGDGNTDRIDEAADRSRSHTYAGNDEGELPDLREAHSRSYRCTPTEADQKRARRHYEDVAENHREGQRQHRSPMVDDGLRVEDHSNRYEEDRGEHIPYRGYELLDLALVPRFSDEGARDEGAECDRIPE
jgi:hypothetical protein